MDRNYLIGAIGLLGLGAGLSALALRDYGVFPPGPMWRVVLLGLGAAAALLLGIWLLLRWQRGGDRREIAALLLGLTLAGLVWGYQAVIPNMVKEQVIADFVAPYVQEDFLAVGVELPDRPRFVFYRRDSGHFTIPSWDYPRGISTPEKLNVIVSYPDQTAGDAEVQIIRLADWSLVESRTFQVSPGQDLLELPEMQAYINELMPPTEDSQQE